MKGCRDKAIYNYDHHIFVNLHIYDGKHFTIYKNQDDQVNNTYSNDYLLLSTHLALPRKFTLLHFDCYPCCSHKTTFDEPNDHSKNGCTSSTQAVLLATCPGIWQLSQNQKQLQQKQTAFR